VAAASCAHVPSVRYACAVPPALTTHTHSPPSSCRWRCRAHEGNPASQLDHVCSRAVTHTHTSCSSVAHATAAARRRSSSVSRMTFSGALGVFLQPSFSPGPPGGGGGYSARGDAGGGRGRGGGRGGRGEVRRNEREGSLDALRRPGGRGGGRGRGRGYKVQNVGARRSGRAAKKERLAERAEAEKLVRTVNSCPSPHPPWMDRQTPVDSLSL